MNSETKAYLVLAVLAISGATVIGVHAYYQAQVEIEAVKAGLVQTVKDNRTIWVKPEQVNK